MLFHTGEWTISLIDEKNISPILDIYRMNEDFLSLGPTPKASLKMVKDDIEHSKNENGKYCVICNLHGQSIGVLDFIPKTEESSTSFLSLIMISAPWRRKGYGKAVVTALEQYLAKSYKTIQIKSGVQINNTDAIEFWRKAGYKIDSKPECRTDNTIVYNMSKDLR
jgi:ribosomal protein S18 acetylase RimI-like enzyme